MSLLLIVGACALAFANGANDNFKGFATIWGSRTLTYRWALILATGAALAGSAASLVIAESLAQRFSGRGLVSDAVVGDPAFIFATGAGAAVAVLAATRAGFPISTTHALVGALIGAGLGLGATLDPSALGGAFFVPLLASPILAFALSAAAYAVLRSRVGGKDCICVTEGAALVASGLAAASQRTWLVVGTERDCDALPVQARASVDAVLARVHIFSATTVCFARSVNDTPKLAALLVAANVVGVQTSALFVAVLMALGGVALARRVAETMSLRIADIDGMRGVAANVVTATLVIAASNLGLPVSTTHVSVGSIAGAGARADTLNWPTLRGVVLSWLATLPIAATCAWALALVF